MKGEPYVPLTTNLSMRQTFTALLERLNREMRTSEWMNTLRTL